MKLVRQKVVVMLRFKAPRFEGLSREVSEISCDNKIRTTLYGSSDNVPVGRVGQIQNVDEWLKVLYQGVPHVRIH